MKDTFYATGRRKESIARVWIKAGKGKDFKVNGKTPDEYFCREDLVLDVFKPLKEVDLEDAIKVKAFVKGGGISGQSGAIRLAIARALIEYDSDLRGSLKQAGLLTRDAREVERKKYGQPKARKKFQFSKR